MIQYLMEKLWAYIIVHNPELMIALNEDNSVTQYLEEKVNGIVPTMEKMMVDGRPDYAAAELCLNELTAELRPSRFIYIGNILEDEFPDDYAVMRGSGTLSYETINLIHICQPVFETLGFSEQNLEDSDLYNAITGSIQLYFEQQDKGAQA